MGRFRLLDFVRQRATSTTRKIFGFEILQRRSVKIAAAMILTLMIAGGGYSAWHLYRPLNFEEPVWVVEPGQTIIQIVNQLQDSGIIDNTFIPRAWAKLNNINKNIQHGEYKLAERTTLAALLKQISKGQGQVKLQVTILDGWTFAQMRAHINAAKKLKIVTADLTNAELMARLGATHRHPEGQFFPDTYDYTAGANDLSIYMQAYEEMQKHLENAWRAREKGLPLKSKYQLLILASIIAKESYVGAEQRRVAGVFYNRLRKGMRLQADPTVIYGIGDAFKGRITRKHLKTDNEYNTYTRGGLTPTPISLPGKSALYAASMPQTSNHYYFVAKGGGLHKFSRTLAEHNRAVNKYIRGK